MFFPILLFSITCVIIKRKYDRTCVLPIFSENLSEFDIKNYESISHKIISKNIFKVPEYYNDVYYDIVIFDNKYIYAYFTENKIYNIVKIINISD